MAEMFVFVLARPPQSGSPQLPTASPVQEVSAQTLRNRAKRARKKRSAQRKRDAQVAKCDEEPREMAGSSPLPDASTPAQLARRRENIPSTGDTIYKDPETLQRSPSDEASPTQYASSPPTMLEDICTAYQRHNMFRQQHLDPGFSFVNRHAVPAKHSRISHGPSLPDDHPSLPPFRSFPRVPGARRVNGMLVRLDRDNPAHNDPAPMEPALREPAASTRENTLVAAIPPHQKGPSSMAQSLYMALGDELFKDVHRPQFALQQSRHVPETPFIKPAPRLAPVFKTPTMPPPLRSTRQELQSLSDEAYIERISAVADYIEISLAKNWVQSGAHVAQSAMLKIQKLHYLFLRGQQISELQFDDNEWKAYDLVEASLRSHHAHAQRLRHDSPPPPPTPATALVSKSRQAPVRQQRDDSPPAPARVSRKRSLPDDPDDHITQRLRSPHTWR
jgi:hypothetical protein